MVRKNYTDDDIIKAVKEEISIAKVLKKLNLKAAGGNYSNLKRKIQKLNLDTSHWKGQAWSKNDRLKDWKYYNKAANLKPHLIKERGHICEKCGLEKWLDGLIPLEIHHKNGIKTENNKENLELLCCNCHSFTENWRNKGSVV